MIIGNNVQSVEFGNVEHGGEFKIRNSAKAFSILSSGLYSNKIRAIIRELSCNALDGHRAKGNVDRQFDVHLPTYMEPHFSVRDYGIGLSHDDILNVYTTYFESTKTGSNELIGGLGLGSKSPFSYTDNFTVTSIKDGEKNIYTAYINEHGLPSITRMATMESDEETGVEVRFPVNDEDFSRFNREAAIVFSVFENHPNVTGNYSKINTEIKYENIIDGVSMYGYNGVHNKAVAIMGNVAYPISVPNAEINLGDLRHILDNNLFIKFDIGSLDIQASREGLSYIPSTIQAIKDKLVELNNALVDVVTDKIKVETNAWKLHHILSGLMGESLFSAATREYIKRNNIPFTNKDNGTVLLQFTLDVESIGKDFNVALIGYERNYRGKLSNLKSNYKNQWHINVNQDTTFIVDDGSVKAVRGCTMQYVREKTTYRQETYLITSLDKTKELKYNEFLAYINDPKVVKAVDLPKPPKKARSKSASGSILVADEANYGGYSYRWSEFDFDNEHDEDAIYYYVPLTNKSVDSRDFGQCSLNDFMDNFMRTGMGFEQITVYGVRKTALKDIEELENWVNFEDYVKETVEKALTNSEIATKIAVSQESFIGQFNDDIIKLIDDKSPVKVAYNKYGRHKYSRINGINQHVIGNLAKKYAPTFDVYAEVDKVAKMFKSIESRYPLIESGVRYNPAQHVAEYINLIDKFKGV